MSRYAKAVVAVLVAGLTVLAAAMSDGSISQQEWVQIAVAGLGAVGVYSVPNRPNEHQTPDPGMSEQG